MSRRLEVPDQLWKDTWLGLAERGDARREAACVWAGTRSEQVERAEAVIFLDDLPGVVGRPYQHRTSRSAVSLMLATVRRMGLRIVGDLHTHPSSWVDMSIVDRAHPIEFRVGLIAIVIPHFAALPVDIASVGVHEYAGDGEWTTLEASDVARRVVILPKDPP